jgi:hypothetical protein
LRLFERKDRGGLDPHFDRSKSPLCERILRIFTLEKFLVFSSLFFLSYFFNSFLNFGGIWECRIWASRVVFPLHLVHRFWWSFTTPAKTLETLGLQVQSV